DGFVHMKCHPSASSFRASSTNRARFSLCAARACSASSWTGSTRVIPCAAHDLHGYVFVTGGISVLSQWTGEGAGAKGGDCGSPGLLRVLTRFDVALPNEDREVESDRPVLLEP